MSPTFRPTSARFLRNKRTLLSVLLGALFATSPALGAWEANVNYGGSGGPSMDLFTPNTPDASPGVVVALHYCTGTAMNARGWFESLANQHGFLVIAPDVGAAECWNAAPERTGERAAIVQMVDYVVSDRGADPARVFAAGASSGACMSIALAAAYPDVFSGASSLAGVAAGVWTGGNSCNGTCSANPPNQSAMAWGDEVRNAFPGFTGQWPRVQLFHGTNDDTIRYPEQYDVAEMQWLNVFGLTEGSGTVANNSPSSGWTRTTYEDTPGHVVLETIIAAQGHDLSGLGLWPDVVRFFGLDMDAPPAGTGGASGTGGETAAGGGGSTGTGGTTTGTGGTTSGAGGSAPGTGGSGPGAGGATSGSGGSVTTSSGGTVSGAGGAVTGAGGAPSGSGGTGDPPGSSGSSCAMTPGSGASGAWAAFLAAGAFALVRRRRRASLSA